MRYSLFFFYNRYQSGNFANDQRPVINQVKKPMPILTIVIGC